MYVILSSQDLARLRPATLADLLSQTSAQPETAVTTRHAPALESNDIDLEGVVDLTLDHIVDLIEGLNSSAIDALQVFAERGPVIDVRLLDDAGVSNYGRFQAAVTRRTRTITGDKNAYLFGWDEWAWDKESGAVLSGRYGVTPTTHRALQEFFKSVNEFSMP